MLQKEVSVLNTIFIKLCFQTRSLILFLIPTLNKKSGPKYIWYVWTGRDFLKPGSNNIIIPILCFKLLRLILNEKMMFQKKINILYKHYLSTINKTRTIIVEGRGGEKRGAKVLLTYRHTYRQTYRPSDDSFLLTVYINLSYLFFGKNMINQVV